METYPNRQLPPDEAMKKRAKKVGIIGIGTLGAMSGISINQARTEIHLSQPNQTISAEDVHGSRENKDTTESSISPIELDKTSQEVLDQAEYLQPALWWPTEVKTNWNLIQNVASEYMLDPYLVATIVAEESGGQNIQNQSGAAGLMQIMPSTAQEVARLRHRTYYNMNDTAQNLDYGCWLIHYIDENYISGRGVDISSDLGIEMLAVYYGDGVGAGELWAKNNYDPNLLSAQAQHVIPLWTGMMNNIDNPHFSPFENRGK